MSIAIINSSTLLSDKDGAIIVNGLNELLIKFCIDWSLPRYTATYVGLGQTTSIPLKVFILDSTTISGIFAYHDNKDGIPYGKCFIKTLLDSGGVTLYSKNPKINTFAETVSHEVFELLVDPHANMWWGTGFQNDMVAGEVCDPVEGHVVTVNVVVTPAKNYYDPVLKRNVVAPAVTQLVNYSDWVLPAWSNPNSVSGPYNHLNNIQAPFKLGRGGYVIVLSGGSHHYAIRGMVCGEDVTPEKQEKFYSNERVSKRCCCDVVECKD
jgi:hypothetical protein